MNEEVVAEKKRNSPPRGARAGERTRRFTAAEKLKAVRLHVEEGFTMALVCQEMGISKSSLGNWLQAYRLGGEAGLQPAAPRSRQDRLPTPIADKIIALKQEHPAFGVKRISQLLRRWFLLPASPETVRQRLHAAELMAEASPPKKRNLTRPRFFERATPNQMWQTDIFTFRLGGRYAYLIAFMDDYSRFIVGADLFRSPTGPSVIEVYRVAVGEFQPPREMLTDNGRQYTSWRGTSRFEAELKKDRVAHFKSRPHHPMTLGKVERFWETIWQEFLCRAQFDSFDAARERIKLWIKYYNHKRPHQGIEGLCPADRFFEIASQLRKTIESGIQENLLEMALRGQPKAPFYMVGRMEGQSVVLRAEKGKLKLSIDNGNENKELTYDLKQDPTPAATGSSLPGQRKSSGSPGGLDRSVPGGGSLPATQDQLHDLPALAAPGHGGDAPGAGEPGQPEQGTGVEPASADAAGQPPATDQYPEDRQPSGANPTCQQGGGCGTTRVDECQSPTTGRTDPQSPLRADDGQGCRPDAGHLPPAILPMGTAGAPGPLEGSGGPTDGKTQDPDRPGEGITPTPGATTGATGATPGTQGTVAPTPEPMGGAGGSSAR